MQPHESPGARPTGMLGALFDFSFDTFIATRIVQLLYVLAMVAAGMFAISALFWFDNILLTLITPPVVFLVSVAYARVLLEVMIVVFRIADNTTEMRESLKAIGKNSEGAGGVE